MRTRLSKSERRKEILQEAREVFVEKGLAGAEMEDIRLACGISRGGLYHHFSNKRAVLDALVEEEVSSLADVLKAPNVVPIPALLRAGSSHLGADKGIILALNTLTDKRDYLSALESAFASLLTERLSDSLVGYVREGVNPSHVAELFLTVNAHINRREILGQWSSAEAASFAITSLEAFTPLLKNTSELAPIIAELKQKGVSQ